MLCIFFSFYLTPMIRTYNIAQGLYEFQPEDLFQSNDRYSLLVNYGERFSIYRLSFKIAILGHATWSLLPDVIQAFLFYHRGSRWS